MPPHSGNFVDVTDQEQRLREQRKWKSRKIIEAARRKVPDLAALVLIIGYPDGSATLSFERGTATEEDFVRFVEAVPERVRAFLDAARQRVDQPDTLKGREDDK